MKDREKNRRIFRTFLPLLFSTFCLADKIASSFTKLSSDDVMGKAGKTLKRYSITEEDVTRKAPRVGANSSSVFAFDMHYK